MTEKTHFIDDLARRLSELATKTPIADIEKNTKALLSGLLSRTQLVSREEFDRQREILAKTRARVTELEARLAILEGNDTAK